MKRRELERKLRKGGWKIHEGGKHGMAKHPDKPGIKIPVPHGSIINDYTAKEIMNKAGVK